MNPTGPSLSIEYLAPGALVAYARNARTHSPEQVEQIAASITEFGFCNPVLIDKAGVLIAGHGRLLAAALLELDQVPVVRLEHVTPEQARALRIADNQIALTSGWDMDMLSAELVEMDDAGIDLAVLGWGDDDLADLTGAVHEPLTFDDDKLNDRSKGRMKRDGKREVVSVGRYIGATDIELIRKAEAILQAMDPDEAAVLVCRLVVDHAPD